MLGRRVCEDESSIKKIFYIVTLWYSSAEVSNKVACMSNTNRKICLSLLKRAESVLESRCSSSTFFSIFLESSGIDFSSRAALPESPDLFRRRCFVDCKYQNDCWNRWCCFSEFKKSEKKGNALPTQCWLFLHAKHATMNTLQRKQDSQHCSDCYLIFTFSFFSSITACGMRSRSRLDRNTWPAKASVRASDRSNLSEKFLLVSR